LIEIGMIEEVENHVPGQRRKYYQQTTSELWKAVEIALRTIGLDPFREPRVPFDDSVAVG
jgi:hypothetical protein